MRWTHVSRFIQRRRLEESAYELARLSRTAPTVSAIAERWGFADPTHFSRVFREAYGLSPREWRIVRLDRAWPPAPQAGGHEPATRACHTSLWAPADAGASSACPSL
ncbi:helix-turn-helix transcriptional regulator [Streptomyces sp. NPDC048430]|uniref:helix-turn-helix transcriptional regulator n=1 Tax=Streptomyces sp. NPDC048430 TaxID=3155388 RepID=UPI0034459A4A